METGPKHSNKLNNYFNSYSKHTNQVASIFRCNARGLLDEQDVLRELIEATNTLVRELKTYRDG